MSIKNPTREEIQNILHTKKRIAVVGLSDKMERTSFRVAQYMKNAGYEIIPVNPTINASLGVQSLKSLKDIEGHVDIVNVFRRNKFLPDIAKETVEIGADVFWSQLGVMNKEAYQYLITHGVTTVMDKCIKVEHEMGK